MVGSEAAGPGSTAAAEGAQRLGSGGGDGDGDESDVMAALRAMRRRAAALKSARDRLLGQVRGCVALLTANAAQLTHSAVDLQGRCERGGGSSSVLLSS